MKRWNILLLVLPLSGCAVNSVHSPAMADVVPPLTATEISGFTERGLVTCVQDAGEGALVNESCRDEIRVKAAAVGGAVVVIEGNQKLACPGNPQTACREFKGRAYAQLPPPAPPPTYRPYEDDRPREREVERASSASRPSPTPTPAALPPPPPPPAGVPWRPSRHFAGDIAVLQPSPSLSQPNVRVVGDVECSQTMALGPGVSMDYLCELDLKKKAYDIGGEALVVQARDVITCENASTALPGSAPCVHLRATVYATQQ